MRLNKFEQFVEELTEKTKKGKISWKLYGNETPLKIKHDDLIKRSFKCSDYKDGYSLYLIEYIIPNFLMSGGEEFDKEVAKLYVADGSVVVKEIDSTEVDPEIMEELQTTVDKKNDRVKSFFEDFDK